MNDTDNWLRKLPCKNISSFDDHWLTVTSEYDENKAKDDKQSEKYV